jgi:hypothetical protein
MADHKSGDLVGFASRSISFRELWPESEHRTVIAGRNRSVVSRYDGPADRVQWNGFRQEILSDTVSFSVFATQGLRHLETLPHANLGMNRSPLEPFDTAKQLIEPCQFHAIF